MPLYAELCGYYRSDPCYEGTYRVGVIGGALRGRARFKRESRRPSIICMCEVGGGLDAVEWAEGRSLRHHTPHTGLQ